MTLASKVRKGTEIIINGTRVRVTKREKWNAKSTKVHFEDCGFGLPVARFGVEMLTIKEKMFTSNEEIVLGTVTAGCTDLNDEHVDCKEPCGLVGCDPKTRREAAEKRLYNVGVTYRGIANFIVEAATPEEARAKARIAFNNGDTPDECGNEYEQIIDTHEPDLLVEMKK